MQIIDNRALLFVTKKFDQISALIPKSKVLERRGDAAKMLVNWGQDEFKLLRNLKIKDLPHPILGKYRWPGVYTPFAHQRTTAAFLATHPRCLVLSEAGTGKTSAAAWAADYLMTQGHVKRVLIVCPVSIMDTAWRSDLFKTVMHRTVAIASGSREKRRQIIQGDYEFVVINFDGVKIVNEELDKGGFDLIIVDEATAIKSVTTDRWKALAALVKPTTRLWLMTGTPASQSPADAYGLAKLVNPDSVPKFFGAFRDEVMVKVSQFRWIPKMTAQDTVFQVLQPAIRFTKEECLDLPEMLYTTREVALTKQQKHYYNLIQQEMTAMAAGEEITAINAAGKLNKLLQISCIAYNTPVLTSRGWVPIQDVLITDQVWDGDEWVAHDGLVSRGFKDVIDLDGVLLTPEHEVYTNDGWKAANDIRIERSQGARFDRTDVRLPDSYPSGRCVGGDHQESAMGLSLPVREHGHPRESVLTVKTPYNPTELRMLARELDTSAKSQSAIPHMDQHETSVPKREGQRLAQLWSAGYSGVRNMGAIIREFLGGYGGNVFAYANAGTHRCERLVLQRELSLGNAYGTKQQQTYQPHGGYPSRDDDCQPSSKTLRNTQEHIPCSNKPIRMDSGTSPIHAGNVEVFDILNCGPQTRFVVKGYTGRPMLVHNCGAAYTTEKEVIEFDVSNRLNELLDVINQTSHKVIVFVPFRHALVHLEQALTKAGVTTRAIHGEVPAHQRAEYIKQFQTEDDPKVILLIPQAAAHGITLTRADTVVWWGPVPSAELYIQGNARAHRAGQKNAVTVVRLQGSPVERRVYAMLDGKVDLHQGIVDLYRQEVLDIV